MESVKQYLLSVICAAIACSLVGSFGEKKGTAAALLKLLTGIFLVFTLVSPISTLKIDELSKFTGNLQEEAASIAALGQEYNKDSMAAYIKSETEAYILDKAATLHVSLTAEVSLNEELQPESVILTGDVSDYARFRLENILEEDLGISKENQQWNE